MNPEKPWTNDISQLFDLDKILNIIPREFSIDGMMKAESFNAVSRFIILLGVLLYIRTSDLRIMFITMIVLFVFVQLFSYRDEIRTQVKKIIPQEMMSTPDKKETLKDLVSLNNPFNNPNPYTRCKGMPPEGIDFDNLSIGSRKINDSLLPNERPSPQELMEFQKQLMHINDNPFKELKGNSESINVLKNQNINAMFRQFYTLPVNDCVNNQNEFAKSLYGDPSKEVFKQKNLDNFAK